MAQASRFPHKTDSPTGATDLSAGGDPRAPQRSMRLEPTAGIFLIAIAHCALRIAHPLSPHTPLTAMATMGHRFPLLPGFSGVGTKRPQ